MFGRILYIGDDIAKVENVINNVEVDDLLNLHVVFEDKNQKILGEIKELHNDIIVIRLLGEFIENNFISGLLRKPKLTSMLRIINDEEIKVLVGDLNDSTVLIGKHAMYHQHKVSAKLNQLFANHVAIFGNSGSGKSYGVTRILQNLLYSDLLDISNSNIFIFDSFGEYKRAFNSINHTNSKYKYKFITTNKESDDEFDLYVPLNLLTVDDVALLLQATEHTQLPIIENTIKLAKIFAEESNESNLLKNHLIAKALIAILFSNETIQGKKNEIFKIIEVCNTNEFNFDTVIPGLGYTRTFSECFEIDSTGQFGESVLITDYILKHVNDNLIINPKNNTSYDLKEFSSALEFTLISEGFLHNKTMYDIASILKVRLNAIVNSKNNNFFTKEYYSLKDYISSLVAVGNVKSQIININLEDVDDYFAKVVVKIISRLLFTFSKTNQNKASIPFHLFLEEAHRFVQDDNDTFLLGYNIFDRIAKEGRKYGILLNIISQRPVELSDTVISQISNFLIFKMTHPVDIKYIEEMLPNISSDIIDKQKTLQPGTCVSFGSAFKIPMIIKLDLPDPEPYSSSADILQVWKN